MHQTRQSTYCQQYQTLLVHQILQFSQHCPISMSITPMSQSNIAFFLVFQSSFLNIYSMYTIYQSGIYEHISAQVCPKRMHQHGVCNRCILCFSPSGYLIRLTLTIKAMHYNFQEVSHMTNHMTQFHPTLLGFTLSSLGLIILRHKLQRNTSMISKMLSTLAPRRSPIRPPSSPGRIQR